MSSGNQSDGAITVICGSMFSGKTDELIRLARRALHARKKVQVFKPNLDTRSDGARIQTHDGTQFHAVSVADSQALESLLEPDTQVVGIEETQFFDEGVVALCRRLADRGVQVIAAGLDQDFRGEPFSFMPRLMALADQVVKLHAICKVCGREASRTQRLVDGRPASWDEPIILIGAEESYEARCRRCHRVPKSPRDRSKSALSSESRLRAKTASNGKNGGHESVTRAVTEEEELLQLEMFPETRETADGRNGDESA